jgi:diaminohydroxyphosphoribosylaminopyrimidine deaminase / 5-amino-6-(5-phosphoribosylamino)uracil reductase
MRRALRLAERGRGSTSPNPPVGAVIVSDGEIVGEGWHRGAGQPHAEVEALTQAGSRARGATLYLTLEPCTHEGRTPPCAPAVIEAGIARVVIAAEDPNPQERGAGIDALRTAGIDVTTEVLGEEARSLIAGFASLMTTGRPLVTLKIAQSLDGRVAAADGSSKWITGPAARRDAHRLRAAADAVLTGVGTVIADDPALTCRIRGFAGRQPTRVILDSTGRTPLDAQILYPVAPTLIAVTHKVTDEVTAALRARTAEVVRFPGRDARVDTSAVITELGARGMTDVLVECGPVLAGDLVEHGLVDRFIFYVAPKLLGTVGLSGIAGLVVPNVNEARELTVTGVRRLGADIRIDAKPRV